MTTLSPELALIAAQALGIAMGGMVAFGSLLIVLLLLNSKRGPAPAFGYVFGYSGCYTLLGFGALLISERVGPLSAGELPIGALLYTALGVLLCAFTIRHWRSPVSTKPPRLFSKIDTMSASKAFAFGALVALINVKNLAIYLSAVAVVARARLPFLQGVVLLLLVVLVFCSLVFLPPMIYLLVPSRSTQLLSGLRIGVEKHSRRIMSWVLPIFALIFLIRGLWGLCS